MTRFFRLAVPLAGGLGLLAFSLAAPPVPLLDEPTLGDAETPHASLVHTGTSTPVGDEETEIKAVTVPPYVVGEMIQFDFEFANIDPTFTSFDGTAEIQWDLSDLFMRDCIDPDNPGEPCGEEQDGAGVKLPLGDLEPNQKKTRRLTFEALRAGEVTLRAEYESETFDPDPANNVAEFGFTVNDPVIVSDLALKKSMPDLGAFSDPVVFMNREFFYEIIVENKSPADAPNTIVVDTLASTLRIVKAVHGVAETPCAVTGQVVRCELGPVKATEKVTVKITVVPMMLGQVANTAHVSAAIIDQDPSNNADSETVNVVLLADLAVTKTGPDTTIAGAVPFVYLIVVKNEGPDDAPDTQMIDTLPPGVGVDSVVTFPPGHLCDETAPGVVCTLGTLAPDESVIIAIHARASMAADSLVNKAEVFVDESVVHDSEPANNTVEVVTQVRRAPFLVLSLTPRPDQLRVFRSAAFTYTVENVGSDEARRVRLDLGYQTAWILAFSSAPCVVSPPQDFTLFFPDLRCEVGDLGVNQSFSVTVSTRILNGTPPLNDRGDRFFVVEAGAKGDNTNQSDDSHFIKLLSTASDLLLMSSGTPGTKRAEHLDLYLDDEQIADDFTLGEARSLPGVPLTNALPTLYTVDGDDPDAAAPLDSFAVDLIVEDPDSLRLSTRSALLLLETADGLHLLVKRDFRSEAADPAQVDLFVAQAAPDVPALDLRLLNAAGQPTVLADALPFDSLSGYVGVAPGFYNAEVTADGALLDVFRFDLSQRAGQALTLAATGSLIDSTFTLLAFDATGMPVASAVVTDAAGEAELPARFALRGNYPNPFNPVTTIQFDLPEAAEVRVEVMDVLGRRVLAVPGQALGAGSGRTVAVDASSLASGVYVYRVIAQTDTRTMTETGRMVVVK